VQARARRAEIAGERGGVVLIRVTAPPVEGRANQAVCRLLARKLGLPLSSVGVVRGERSRDKLVEVEGMTADALRRSLGVGP
jgi:uncharacterized protein (TIGR00251 family)